MSQVHFTDEQKQVIENRQKNLLVSAQAGAGKTAVLVDRVIREILEDGRSLKNMLIVTFTNKAANSLKEKIRQALTDALQAEEGGEALSPQARYRLLDQLNSLASANIQTLHAFCYEKIQEHFDRLGMDPGVHIIEAKAFAELKGQAMDALLNAVYEAKDPDMMAFIEAYGLSKRRDDQPLQEMVESLSTCMDQAIAPEEWVKGQLDWLGSPDYLEESLQAYKDAVVIPLLKSFLQSYDRFLAQAADQLGQVDAGLGQAYAEALQGEPLFYEEAVAAYFSGDRAMIDQAPNFKALTVSKKYGEEAVQIKNNFKKSRDRLRRLKDSLVEEVKKMDPDLLAEESRQMKEAMGHLVRLTLDYRDRLQVLKKENRALSFDDMEHLMIRLLQMDEAREELRVQYQSIYFDEYQDASDLQNYIIEQLAGERNLFFVGDIKQSIYAFRKAQPRNFLARMKAYREAPDALSESLFLTYNFRSEKNILDFINVIFDPLMVPERGEIAYASPDQRGRVNLPALERAQEDLAQGRLPGKVEVALLEQEKEEEDEEDLSAEGEDYINEKPAGAFYLARWIKNYLAEDPSHSYRDITVLFRKNVVSLNYDYVLRYFDIRTHADFGGVDMEATELAIALNLLKVIDNSREDLPLVSLLSSYIGNFTDDDLATLRLFYPQGSFYEGFFALLDGEDPPEAAPDMAADYAALRAKGEAFWEKILAFRRAQDLMPFGEFVAYVFRTSGFYDFVLAMDHGPERKENLHLLLRYAQLYEEEGKSDLTGMIRRLEEETGSGGEGMNPANDLSESDNVVRLMTIHASKGLDSKVVVLADLAARFHGKSTAPYSFSTEEGLSLAVRKEDEDTGKILEGPSLRLNLDKTRQMDHDRDEEVRIFYVALTRAVSRLLLIGGGKDLSNRFLAPLARNEEEVQLELDQGKSFQDWLITLLRHDRASLLRAEGSIGKELKNQAADLPKGTVFSDELLADGRPVDGFSLLIEKEGAYRPWDGTVVGALDEEKERHDPGAAEALWARAESILAFTYPDPQGQVQPIKKSVTELVAGEERAYFMSPSSAEGPSFEEGLLSPPDFLQAEAGIHGADYGTIMHNVLQALPIRPYSREELEAAVRSLLDRRYLSPEAFEVVDMDQLLSFYQSPLGLRLHALGSAVHREEAFTLRIHEKDLPGALQAGEGQRSEGILTIDGRMDLYADLSAEEGGKGLLLLDFKTDRLRVMARYRDQVRLYAMALEKALGKPVEEAYIFWVRHGRSDRMDLS